MDIAHWIYIFNALFIVTLWILTQYHKRMDILIQTPYDDRIQFDYDSYHQHMEMDSVITKQSEKKKEETTLIIKMENNMTTKNIMLTDNTKLDSTVKRNKSIADIKMNNTIEKEGMKGGNKIKTSVEVDVSLLQAKNNPTQHPIFKKPTSSEIPTVFNSTLLPNDSIFFPWDDDDVDYNKTCNRLLSLFQSFDGLPIIHNGLHGGLGHKFLSLYNSITIALLLKRPLYGKFCFLFSNCVSRLPARLSKEYSLLF